MEFKGVIKAPSSCGPIEDIAFSSYAMHLEESALKRKQALEYLLYNPHEEKENLQSLFDLTDEDYYYVIENF